MPLTSHTIYILIHFDPKKDLKFGIFSSLIVGLSYARGGPLQPPKKFIYTYKSELLKSLKLYILPHLIQIFLHKGALPWTPVKGFPLDPIRGPIGGAEPHSWFLALRTWCFSLQAIPKSWKPCWRTNKLIAIICLQK